MSHFSSSNRLIKVFSCFEVSVKKRMRIPVLVMTKPRDTQKCKGGGKGNGAGEYKLNEGN